MALMPGGPTAAPHVPTDQDKTVREQLERILGSSTFQQGDRLKRFLRFIVLEAIAGRRNELKEYVVGVQVFGKEEAFDPRTDPIVRVQANKLRMRLKAYYAVAAPPPRCKSKYRRAPMFRRFGSTRRRIPVDGTGCA